MFPNSFAGKKVRSQTFTSSGIFYPDQTATCYYVEAIAAGKAGDSSAGNSAGGYGGMWDFALIPAALLTIPVAVTIGAGGTPSGGIGGDTSFGSFLKVFGADSTPGTGTGTNGGPGYNNGGGGQANNSPGNGGNSVRGGAGGGAASPGSTANGTGGTSRRAGNGGNGNYAGTGSNGTAPGGGGGGGVTGGSGGAGQVTVYWW